MIRILVCPSEDHAPNRFLKLLMYTLSVYCYMRLSTCTQMTEGPLYCVEEDSRALRSFQSTAVSHSIYPVFYLRDCLLYIFSYTLSQLGNTRIRIQASTHKRLLLGNVNYNIYMYFYFLLNNITCFYYVDSLMCLKIWQQRRSDEDSLNAHDLFHDLDHPCSRNLYPHLDH